MLTPMLATARTPSKHVVSMGSGGGGGWAGVTAATPGA